jgi:transposase
VVHISKPKEALMDMMHVGLDLSRKRLDICVLDAAGSLREELRVSPDRESLARLPARVAGPETAVRAVIESMTGARFVHDQLELAGWQVEIADAVKVKGLAPLTCKTDRIDARVLADLSWRDLIPAIWMPPPAVRGERELARFRMHLVKHRTALKNRIHSTLLTHGVPRLMSDLFGTEGRRLLERLGVPEPWAGNVTASLLLIDHLNEQIEDCERALRQGGADHPDIPLLMTVPGIGWVLAYTIAAEIGDINRFASPNKLASYSGLCPKVEQSGERDRRGRLTKHGPPYLRWALIEATVHAAHHCAYNAYYERTRTRLGRQRGPKVARIEVARRLAEAIWYMLTRRQPFHPHIAPPSKTRRPAA